MHNSQTFLISELSPQRKIALRIKQPTIKLNTSLRRPLAHKHTLSDFVASGESTMNSKVPVSASNRRAKEIPKLLFTKVRQDVDMQLTTTRARKRPANIVEPLKGQSFVASGATRGPQQKLTRQRSSPRRLVESLSSTESLAKEFTPRRTGDEEIAHLWRKTKLPTSAATVLKIFMSKMSNFEQSEILSYCEVYCIGNGFGTSRKDSAKNYGFDDDRGDYKIVVGDHIAYRYEVVALLGRGSFGQVVKAMDHKVKKEVALKIIRNKSRFHEQALVEIDVLKYLKERDPSDDHSIVHLEDYFAFRNHMCITFELLSMNLYEFLKTNQFQGLSASLIRRFAEQIINALMLLNRHKIIHCDLKPENIMLKTANRSALKVIDLGSSCFYSKRIYTYIQSRFYRAPEIMLGISYTTSIDMWSFGCILVELYTGYPLFPGESEAEQIQCIMEVLGLPPTDLLERSTRKKLFFDSDGTPKLSPNSRGKVRLPGRKSLRELLRGAEFSFVGLVRGCLEWDPNCRFTPEEVMAHEWMESTSKLHKSSSRGGSAQPHQGLTTRHHKKNSDVGPKIAFHRAHKS